VPRIRNLPSPRIWARPILPAFFLLFLLLASGAQAQETTIVYNAGVAPLKFDDDAGEPAGILLDIWRRWSEKTGRPIRFIRTETFSESLDMVREGRADLNAGLFHTAEREEFLEFSEPVFTLNYHIFTHPALKAAASLEDLQGLVVGVPQGGFTRDLVGSVVPQELIREYGSNEELFEAALHGEIKAFVSTEVALLYFLDQNRLANIFGYVKDAPLSSQTYRAGARKGRTELVALVDSGLAGIDAGEREALLQRWLASGVRTIPPEFALLLTPEERVYLARKSGITVHNESDWAPYNFNEKGEPKGYSIDYIRLLAEKIGLDVNFVSGLNWREYTDKLLDGSLDVMLNSVPTPERREHMVFTPPYVDAEQMLFTRTGEPRVNSIEGLFGKRFAVPRGFFYQETLSRYPEIHIVEVRDSSEAIHAVSSGRADALLDLIPVVDFIRERHDIANLQAGGHVPELMTDTAIPMHLAVSSDKSRLAGVLAKGMTLLRGEELRALEAKWLGRKDDADAVRFRLTPEEEAWLAGHGELRLGTDTNWPPFEQLDSLGNYAGIAADYVSALQAQLGVQMLRQPDHTWEEARTLAGRKELDVIACIAHSVDQESSLLLTKPYFSSRIVVITREDAPFISEAADLAGKTVGVIRDGVTSRGLARDYPAITRKPYDSVEDGLKAVSLGHADAFVDNLASITYAMGKTGIDNLKVAAFIEYAFSLSFGVRSDWPELVAILNRALEAIPKDERARIHDRWINVRFERDVDWTLVWQIALIVAVFVGGILLVVFIWNRRLAREIGVRRRAEQKLVESEAITRAMSGAVADGLIMIDAQSKVLFWNPAAERMFGYTVAEAMGQSMHDLFVGAEQRAKAMLGLARFAKTGQGPVVGVTGEYTALDRQGRPFPVEVAVSSFQVHDAWYAVGSVRDITERKRAEHALRDAEERSRLVLESAGEGIFGVNADGGLLFINTAACKMLGVCDTSVIGKNVHELIHHSFPDGSPYPEENCPMFKSYSEGSTHHIENEVLWRADDTSFPVEYTSSPIYKDEELVGAVVTFRDITKRLEARRALAEKQSFLQSIIDNSSALIYVKDLEGRYILGNAAWRRTSASGFAEPLGLTDFDLFPKEMARELRENDRKSIESLSSLSWEEIVTTDSGERIDYYSVKFPLLDVDGKPYAVCGMSTDITQRKKIEATLRESEQRHRIIFEKSPLGMILFDSDGAIQDCNDMFVQLMGSTREKLIGFNTARESSQTVREVIQHALTGAAAVFEGEYTSVTGGKTAYLRISFNPIEPGKSPTGVIATVEDITERQLFEDKLRGNLEQLERFSRLVVGREERMIQLKQEINDLLAAQGLDAKYKIVE
jgi:PAS domain S-box-containing protein